MQAAAPGTKGFATRIDVTDLDSCRAAVERTVSEFGRIDVLANFAGVIQEAHDVESLPVEEWDRVIGINLRGHFLMAKAAVGQFKAQRSGRIVLITSIWSHEGFDLFSAYCASKGGLKLFTQSLGQGDDPVRRQRQRDRAGHHQHGAPPEGAARRGHGAGLVDDDVREKEWGKIPTQAGRVAGGRRQGRPLPVLGRGELRRRRDPRHQRRDSIR